MMNARVMAEPYEVMDDAEVVTQVRRGQREAYRVLVDRYQDTLYRYALSMVGERDVAADLVQASFVNAYARLKRLRDASNFGGWVYRICVNACRDQLKSRRRRDVPLERSPAESMTSRERPDAALERVELRRTLDDALATLPEEHRAAFVLKHVEGRSYEEIAKLLDTSVPALKMRVHRAREALKSALEEVL